jgi:hypothetical protein
MAVTFTPEQIRYIRDSFQDIFTEEEKAALGGPNKIKCGICKWSCRIALGTLIAAALASGDLDEDAPLIEALSFFADVSSEVARQWLEEATTQGMDASSQVIHFICVKMKACKK